MNFSLSNWPHKKKFSLSSPPASEFPAASIFFICLIPHKNKVYGFVYVVVMNFKSKNTIFRVLGGKYVSVTPFS